MICQSFSFILFSLILSHSSSESTNSSITSTFPSSTASTFKEHLRYGVSPVAMGYCPVLDSMYYRPLIIEGARFKKLGNRTEIIVLFDSSCYSNITDVTVKYFPVISEEMDQRNRELQKFPICNTGRDFEKEGFEFYPDFEFDGLHGTYWRDKRLIGDNRVWLGCPQDLCLDPNIDALLVVSGKPKKFVRGRHMYDINEKTYELMPTLPRVVAENNEIGLTKFTPKGYFTASFHMRGIDYLIQVRLKLLHPMINEFPKRQRFWYHNATTSVVSYLPLNAQGIDVSERFTNSFPSKVDTVFAFGPYLYVFYNGEYNRAEYCDTCKPVLVDKTAWFRPLQNFSKPLPVAELHPEFPNKLNAMFFASQNNVSMIHLMADWKYYKFAVVGNSLEESLKDLPSLESISQDLLELFGCDDSYYAKRGFASRLDFIKKVNEFSKSKKSAPKEEEVKEPVKPSSVPYFVGFGIVVLVMLGLSLGVWYALITRKEQIKKRKNLLNKIEAEVRPRRGIKVSKRLTDAEKKLLLSSDVMDRRATIRSYLDNNS